MQNEIPSSPNKGSVILAVLGILALLSLLGIALISMTRQEESSARRFVDQSRAQLVAESGIDTAISRLLNYDSALIGLPSLLAFGPEPAWTPLKHISYPSFAVDINQDGNLDGSSGLISETYAKYGDQFKLKVRSSQSKLNINDTNSPVNLDTEPFEDQLAPERDYLSIAPHMRNPTVPGNPTKDRDPDWAYKPANWNYFGDPDFDGDGDIDEDDANTMYEKEIDVSGDGIGELADFSLMMELVQSGFDPIKSNKGLPHPKSRGRLEIILAELLTLLFPNPSQTDLGHKVSSLLFRRRAQLPNERFENFDQVKELLVPKWLNKEQFDILKSHLTLHAWQDSNVLKPTFQWRISRPATDMSFYAGDWPPFLIMGVYPDCNLHVERPIFGGEYNGNSNFHDVYIYSDMQTAGFETENRSPIDINEAPKILLRSLLRPLSGHYLKEAPGPDNAFDTAEDLSVPALCDFQPQFNTLPWMKGYHFIVQLSVDLPDFPNGYATYYRSTKYQYYYYDEFNNAYVEQQPGNPGNYQINYTNKNNRFGQLRKTQLGPEIADAVADAIYRRVHNMENAPVQIASSAMTSPLGLIARGDLTPSDGNGDGLQDFHPFRTWEEFEDFIRDLADQDGVNDIPDFDFYMADLVIANFNPNSRINDYNPDKRFFLHTDKSQLENFTTEFCFHTMGLFETESLGIVKKPDGSIAAEHSVCCAAQIFTPFRITTQAQFMEGYDPSRADKQSKTFLTTASGIGTAGLDFVNGSSVADWSYTGNTLQSYPEPEFRHVSQNWIKDSVYDGHLGLSILKPKAEDFYDEYGTKTFYCSYRGMLSIDLGHAQSGNPFVIKDNSSDFWMQNEYCMTRDNPDLFGNGIPFWVKDVESKIPANNPREARLAKPMSELVTAHKVSGNLYPDGAFSDTGRSLKYDARNVGKFQEGNVDSGKNASLQFWIKPGFDTAHSNRIRNFFDISPKDIKRTLIPANGQYQCGPVWNTLQVLADWYALLYFPHGGKRIVSPAEEPAFRFDIYEEEDWIATRSLFCGNAWGWGSSPINQSWRGPGQPFTNQNPEYNFETRQWNCISMSWHNSPLGTPFNVAINGVPIPELFNYGGAPNRPHTLLDGSPNYVRFGENSTAPIMNSVADSTFDCIVSLDAATPDPEPYVIEYSYGRHYSDEDAMYNSPTFDIFNKLALDCVRLELHSFEWTLYMPMPANEGKPANHPRWNGCRGEFSDLYQNVEGLAKTDNLFSSDPMMLRWGADMIPISVNIKSPATGNWFYPENGVAAFSAMPNFAGGSMDPDWRSQNLGWKKGQSFEFRVHFNMEGGQTLYASPIFDDITFMFKRDRAKLLEWISNYEM